jgi:hypothetical protein
MLFKNILKLVFLIYLSGCLQTENSSSTDGAGPEGSNNFLAASEVFYNKCSGCHDYHTLSEADFVSFGLALPGDPAGSSIYYRLVGSAGPGSPKNMPSVGSISGAEVTIISDWIMGIP